MTAASLDAAAEADRLFASAECAELLDEARHDHPDHADAEDGTDAAVDHVVDGLAALLGAGYERGAWRRIRDRLEEQVRDALTA